VAVSPAHDVLIAKRRIGTPAW